MHIRIGLLPSMFIGYLLGCFFTPYMYIDLQMTQWQNVFTYIWIFFWPLALIAHFVLWFLSSGVWLICLAVGLFLVFSIAAVQTR